jgi:hypothetical protein
MSALSNRRWLVGLGAAVFTAVGFLAVATPPAPAEARAYLSIGVGLPGYYPGYYAPPAYYGYPGYYPYAVGVGIPLGYRGPAYAYYPYGWGHRYRHR